MRSLPNLTDSFLNRAVELTAKAHDRHALGVTDGAPVPDFELRNSIAPARVKDGVATLRLYDYIVPDCGYWGISALEFAEALDDAGDVTKIVLRINSGGGSVWDGLAILNTLRSHEAPVTAVVDGIAASAASFIAAAADEVEMMPNSKLMIHDAMGVCFGQAVDMREYADFLDESSANIAEIYAARTGGSVDDWRTKMTENGLMGTWYSAEQAVEAGLADRVGGQADDTEDAPTDRLTAALTPEQVRAAEGLKPVAETPAAEATDDRRLRFQQRRHARNQQRATRTA